MSLPKRLFSCLLVLPAVCWGWRGASGAGLLQAGKAELSCSELARMTGLPQPTTWRLCYTMLNVGVLVMIDGERLRSALPVLRPGHSAVAGSGIVELARPHLQQLADGIKAAPGAGTRDCDDMAYLQRCESVSDEAQNRIAHSDRIVSDGMRIAGSVGRGRTQEAHGVVEDKVSQLTGVERGFLQGSRRTGSSALVIS